MWPYWLAFLAPTILSLVTPFGRGQRGGRHLLHWLIASVALVLFIGLRHEVGGDWFNYLGRYQDLQRASLEEALLLDDPGFMLVNWLCAQLGLGVHAVNLICAGIFTTGLVVFCRRQPNPWLALVVAVPYIVIVVAMGYTRQAVALGLLFLGLSYLQQARVYSFMGAIAVAALFHKTALIMLPLGIFLYSKGWWLHAIAVVAAAYALWDLLLAEDQNLLWRVYVEQAMHSEGAKVRAYMNFMPAVALLVFWKRWRQQLPVPSLWLVMAAAALIGAGLVDYASTAVDRMSLYLTPLQIVVLSRLPLVLKHEFSIEAVMLGVIFVYAAVTFVWLNYATHAQYWLPYQNILFI